jgi:glycosyltransferase involved in cell wall biosynthesis
VAVIPYPVDGVPQAIAAAMYYGKPVIATGYAGNMDFMNENTASQGSGQPHYRENYAWAEPSGEHLESLLRHVVEHQDEARATGIAAQRVIRENYSTAAISPK